MTFLESLTIRKRLAYGFGVILLLMIVLTVMGIQKVNFIDHTLADITDVNSVKQRFAINYRGSVHDRAIAIRDVALARSQNEVRAIEADIIRLQAFYAESEQSMQAMMDRGVTFTPAEQRILSDIRNKQQQTLPIVQEVLDRKRRGETLNDEILDHARPAFTAWLASINEFIDYQEAANQQATPKARDVAGNFEYLMFWLTLGAVVISVAVGVLIEKSLRHSLGGEPFRAAGVLTEIAQGNLAEEVTTAYPQSMLGSIQKMRLTLSGIVANIVSAAAELTNQAGQLAIGSGEIYNAAQSQATLTQQTHNRLDALQQVTLKVTDIAARTEENSSQTVNYANQGRTAIAESFAAMESVSKTVNETVTQIRQLEERTKQIGGITSVISGISEQTNLLALNAAIEAARAGESGRGFAVVADEVRNLAKRTGEATAEIEVMLGQVQEETAASVAAMEKTQPQVESGTTLIQEAAQLLLQINEQASDSLDRVKDVVAMTAEQKSAINEASEAMREISRMSENAIVALEQNRMATQALNGLSTELKGNVAFFKLSRV
ncbi:methyl-accepting chemotaxis protein [Planctobacterium marinum]|uniref:methyl-accepting chemotaxis protein n=1 Tax=Planctobacterium marinum TaxID=1631968 RepID=UPI001E3F3A93|nr:methyl-accepting chemotaxis protein [Planctobacterium marinum]MCC2606815.1 methyl-accepting chemotaxis protein [Planctobacterium marinum]